MTFDFALSRLRVAAKAPPMGAVGVCQSVDWLGFHYVRTQYEKIGRAKWLVKSLALDELLFITCILTKSPETP